MPTTDNIALELDQITRHFHGRTVVDGVSLKLHAGQVTCLLGPSGCGKSTTLRIAAGVDRQDQGRVLLDWQVVSGAGQHLPPEARNVGLMFQDFALFPHLSVRDNIGFGLPNGQGKARVDELMERLALSGHANQYPHQLSGGEQQRVALARALAPSPKVLLMDEPFSGLDDRLRDTVRDHTLDLLRAEGAAVLLVTHEPTEAMRMADQIALMRAGKLVQIGAPYNIYNAPKDRAAAAFFSDLKIITGHAKGALVETPFGEFFAPGLDDVPVDICIRPQHLKIDFDRAGRGPNPTPEEGVPARGVVARARYLGDHSLIEFDMDFENICLQVQVPGVFLPKAGTALWLSMRRDRCFDYDRDRFVADL